MSQTINHESPYSKTAMQDLARVSAEGFDLPILAEDIAARRDFARKFLRKSAVDVANASPNPSRMLMSRFFLGVMALYQEQLPPSESLRVDVRDVNQELAAIARNAIHFAQITEETVVPGPLQIPTELDLSSDKIIKLYEQATASVVEPPTLTAENCFDIIVGLESETYRLQ